MYANKPVFRVFLISSAFVLGIFCSSSVTASNFDLPTDFSQRFIVLEDGASKIGVNRYGITLTQHLGNSPNYSIANSAPAGLDSGMRFNLDEDLNAGADYPTISNEVTSLLIRTNSYAYGVAYDSVDEKIFWTSSGDEVIKQADVNGNNVIALKSNFETPYLIEVDSESYKTVYAVIDNAITMSTLDFLGNLVDSTVLLNVDESQIHGLALSQDQTKLYFCDQYARIFGLINLGSALPLPTPTVNVNGRTTQASAGPTVNRLDFNYMGEPQ